MQRWLVGAQLTLDFFGEHLRAHPLRVSAIDPDDAVKQVAMNLPTISHLLPPSLTFSHLLISPPPSPTIVHLLPPPPTIDSDDAVKQVAITGHSVVLELRNSPVHEFNMQVWALVGTPL